MYTMRTCVCTQCEHVHNVYMCVCAILPQSAILSSTLISNLIRDHVTGENENAIDKADKSRFESQRLRVTPPGREYNDIKDIVMHAF